jgi:hypothetical protein
MNKFELIRKLPGLMPFINDILDSINDNPVKPMSEKEFERIFNDKH